MMAWVDPLSGALVVAGALFCVVGGIGILRLPDFFARTHATSIGDTLGAGLVICGLALRAVAEWIVGEGGLDVVFKLVLLLAFIYVVSPTASHALAKAAHAGGVKVRSPEEGSSRDAPA